MEDTTMRRLTQVALLGVLVLAMASLATAQQPQQPQLPNGFQMKELKQILKGALSSVLNSREERIVRLRFGIGREREHTLEEVGQEFKVTRERIRQIEVKAIKKLRHPGRDFPIRSYIERR